MMGSTRRGAKDERGETIDTHDQTRIGSKTESHPDNLVQANPERDAAMNMISLHRAHEEPEEDAVLGQEANTRLGRQLKELYEKVARDPIPERFIEILAQLEKQKKQD